MSIADSKSSGDRPIPSFIELVGYAAIGAGFALVLAKSEAISWFRIHEMFRFQSFHMYGLLGSAVLTAGVSLHLLKRSGARARNGEPIEIEDKQHSATGRAGRSSAWAGACSGRAPVRCTPWSAEA